ncbi:MAG: AAA family ATPase [Cytophagales bacterium]|jgi:predicted AAA+ superfamily ATPase|nr:AAA family ATPase [Cytophagales bacterium]MCA6389635.1 AAA family ATPase [Cytophagales bacterium]MCA6389744.1 AAA family ATPase [Cytophagales bacterium]MCA6393716.1 AAA family ATPase [Cytophagales bacterium]MCA6397800.1 AAA family ATPase [Cytophagales bacterium]
MLDRLFTFQAALLKPIENQFTRSLYDSINWKQRMLGIKGLRGIGKTTLLLQHLKYTLKGKGLYVTADHPWFYDHSLLDLAEEFEKNDGRILLIDEIHKYPQWATQLKNIYDGHPSLQIIFTASSALEIQKGQADLSRRVLSYELTGLSFREYLHFFHGQVYPIFTLEEIIKNPQRIISSLQFPQKVLPLFKNYLRYGYFPFSYHEPEGDFIIKLNQVINTVLETDLAAIEGYTAGNVVTIKKLLGVLSESVPFTPNIASLANKMKLGRDTVNNFIQHLERARLFNLIYHQPKGVAALQKPDKIYLENTNVAFALKDQPDVGSLRETFFFNQLRNAGYAVSLSENGDFLVNKKWTFEVGGSSKGDTQVKKIPNSYLALDGIETAYQNRIPLWVFGFLY